VKHKILTESQLEDPLLQHMREEKPLGRILVERGICRPEQILCALIDRDNARQEEFFRYVRSHIENDSDTSEEIPPSGVTTSGKFSTIVSSILKKPNKK
jgi:hypothetical protein